MTELHPLLIGAMLFVAGIWVGAQNALAGGGSFVSLPALILAGLPPIAANVTSTIALFPGQIAMGWSGRKLASGTHDVSFRMLVVISLIGGAIGALLLVNTSEKVFAQLVPWLVLGATAVFVWGNFFRNPAAARTAIGPVPAYAAQGAIAIYGGYFGGGIGILMMAALSMAGLPVRAAGSTKNVLAAVMNASAFAMLALSPLVSWTLAAPLAAGAIVGGLIGAWALKRVNETALKIAVALIGLALSIGLFMRPVG